MAFFDKVIPPGGEGKIQLKVNTVGFQGAISKSARVISNDSSKRTPVLRLMAIVKVAISMSPQNVYLYGAEGQSITASVEIAAGLDKTLTLTPTEFSLAGKLSYSLEEIEKGRKYRIQFKSIPGPPERYYGFLKLKTNYPEKPEMIIRIRGQIVEIRKG